MGWAGRSRLKVVSLIRQYLPQICVLIFVADMPDLDILVEVFVRRDLHHGVSHSLLAATVVAFLGSWLWEIAGSFWRSFALYFTAYGSHLLIDVFTGDWWGWTRSGSGIPLFWPWPKEVSSPLILAYGVHQRKNLFSALFSAQNLWGRGYDLVVFGGLTVILLAWQRSRAKRGGL